MDIVLDGLIFLTGWAHVILAPYTKVEESFNLHAAHDILMYGVGPDTLKNFDHFVFPGAVPRTFFGSVLLAWLSAPIIQLGILSGLVSQKIDLQIVLRLVLSSLNALGLCAVRRAVSRRYGHISSQLFTVLTITQFHLPFWMGRTLPNMLALFPVNIALSLLIDRQHKQPRPSDRHTVALVSLLIFTGVVLRAEVALLVIPVALQLLLHGSITLEKLGQVCLFSGVLSCALTVSVDSYFWQRPYLWPEFQAVYFNVYQGKSADWGTSSSHAYWTSHLPKLLLSSLPLSIIGFLRDQRTRTLLLPYLLFIGLLSRLGHKEWRFIIYVVPAFNVAASRSARKILSLRKNTFSAVAMMFILCTGLLALNLATTGLLTLASINNYPGGHALALIHTLKPQPAMAQIHISNLAAQSGASLFLQLNSPPSFSASVFSDAIPRNTSNFSWTYDKTENLSLQDLTADTRITHLIVEAEPDLSLKADWVVKASVTGFDRWQFDRAALNRLIYDKSWGELVGLFCMIQTEKLWLLNRR